MTTTRKSLFGGYPHEGTKSIEAFPIRNRLHPKLIDGKIMTTVDMGVYPHFPTSIVSDTMEGNDTALKDFLLDRIADYDQALNIAEQQIKDISAEYPFIPEDFGFELTELRANTGPDNYNPPMYKKDNFVMARVEDDKWLLADAGSKLISLPNAHIAFIVLRSLGVITDEEFAGDTEFSVNETDLSEADKENIAGLEDLKIRLSAAKFEGNCFLIPGELNPSQDKFIVPSTKFYPERLWGIEVRNMGHIIPITEKEMIELQAILKL